jgi:hypothetical protein
MRLIKCPACDNDISDEAQSCPKCGQPVTEKMRNSGVTQDIARRELRRSSGQRALIVVAIIAAAVIFFAWMSTQTGSSSGGDSGGNASKQGSPTTAQTQASTAPAAPILPSHNYRYEKDGEYGYESELSQDQIEAGVASAPMLMVRYLGQRRGRYRAEIVSGASTSVLSCSSPCSYITARDYYHNPYSGSELIDKEVIPAGNTVAASIMQDAMNGQLRVYGARRRAAHARWLAAQARRPPYVTTAVAFIAANERSEHTTKRAVEGRRVQVSGIVTQKGIVTSKGVVPQTTLWLSASPNLILNFLNSEHAMIAHVHRGQSVTALCQSMDWFMGEPEGEKCWLLPRNVQ